MVCVPISVEESQAEWMALEADKQEVCVADEKEAAWSEELKPGAGRWRWHFQQEGRLSP